MQVRSLELQDFRNFEQLNISFGSGVNIFYGDNAQGKTNLLDAVFVGCTSKSHRLTKDRDMIRFGCQEAHIRLRTEKKEIPYRIDMHLKKNSSKGIAVNGVPIRRSSELFGIANVVMFSAEDLGILKNGPSERRRFLDMELCQLDRVYLHDLVSYTKLVNQKNRVLKEYEFRQDAEDLIDIYNSQMISCGTGIIRRRAQYLEELKRIMRGIHLELTGGKEEILVSYEPQTEPEALEEELARVRKQEIRQGMCLAGPHRDDIRFSVGSVDLRMFGSQGQQRTAALSLKLSEIRITENASGERPLLLLDDVLSELDRKRQDRLFDVIREGQTFISCTGLDELVGRRIRIDKVFHVSAGHAVLQGEEEWQKKN